jgi:hypothetical protein
VRNYFTDSDLFDLGYNYYYPVCHPRGQGLLVVVQVDPKIPGRELWWVLPDGSYEVVFNDLSQIVTQFTWSPDGSKVLFLSDSLAGLSDGSKIGIWETESFSSQQLFSDYIFQAHWLP